MNYYLKKKLYEIELFKKEIIWKYQNLIFYISQWAQLQYKVQGDLLSRG